MTRAKLELGDKANGKAGRRSGRLIEERHLQEQIIAADTGRIFCLGVRDVGPKKGSAGNVASRANA